MIASLCEKAGNCSKTDGNNIKRTWKAKWTLTGWIQTLWGVKEAIYNGKQMKLIKIYNKLRIYKVGLTLWGEVKDNDVRKKYLPQSCELKNSQGWKILQFYPARLRNLIGYLWHIKKLQERKCTGNRAKFALPEWLF